MNEIEKSLIHEVSLALMNEVQAKGWTAAGLLLRQLTRPADPAPISEADETRLIEQRDAAEEALSQAYRIVTGDLRPAPDYLTIGRMLHNIASYVRSAQPMATDETMLTAAGREWVALQRMVAKAAETKGETDGAEVKRLTEVLQNVGGGSNIPGFTTDTALFGDWREALNKTQAYARAALGAP